MLSSNGIDNQTSNFGLVSAFGLQIEALVFLDQPAITDVSRMAEK